MEKDIWVISNNREEILTAQRGINSTGSMRARCVLSYEALERLLFPCKYMPSIIILDYEMSVEEEFRSLTLLKKQPEIGGIPLFFMTNQSDVVVHDECYCMGALAVLEKPFNPVAVERIEQMAWQFDVARSMEKKLEQQSNDLKAAREIERLNRQLQSRNDLLHQVFGRYFPDELVEQIFEDSSEVSLGGEKTDLTVMFTDLRGFTAISQTMDSDAMLDLLNYYFGKMVEVIRAYKGTFLEFLGDGILAVFGAPVALEDHTEYAVSAAVEMQNTMAEINRFCEAKGYAKLNMGIGIHKGEAFIGNIGSDTVMRYNVQGRVINECSRIESYSVGNQILVSQEAVNALHCEYRIREKHCIQAKGVDKPLVVHEITEINGHILKDRDDAENGILFAKEWSDAPKFLDGEEKAELLLDIFLVERKVIGRCIGRGRMLAMYKDSLFVELEKDVEVPLELFQDVKLVESPESGSSFEGVPSGIYAKMMDKRERKMNLRITHADECYYQWLEKQMESR